MKILRHPYLPKFFPRFFLLAFTGLSFIMGLAIYVGNHGGKSYTPFFLGLLFFGFIFFFGYTWYRMHAVACPECKGKTQTASYRHELSTGWSAYCAQCDILWDIGLGNDNTL